MACRGSTETDERTMAPVDQCPVSPCQPGYAECQRGRRGHALIYPTGNSPSLLQMQKKSLEHSSRIALVDVTRAAGRAR